MLRMPDFRGFEVRFGSRGSLTAFVAPGRIERLAGLYASVWKTRHAARLLCRRIEKRGLQCSPPFMVADVPGDEKPETLRLDLEGATCLTACCALTFSARFIALLRAPSMEAAPSCKARRSGEMPSGAMKPCHSQESTGSHARQTLAVR